MKAKITSIEFQKEYPTQFGTLNLFKIGYNNKYGFYSSKYKDQKKFKIGEEAEFSEEIRTGKHSDYINIKPVYSQGFSNYGRAIKKEQSRYSGFSDSYVKDMLTSGILIPENDEEAIIHNDIVMITWKKRAFEIFEHMVELDKTLKA